MTSEKDPRSQQDDSSVKKITGSIYTSIEIDI